MTAATRRLWLYGLLLLLPALAVGGLALGLLAREQDRLAEREQAARETRRAAVETRARLIAENIELLLGDVQSALMTTLQEAPVEEPRAFLAEWKTTNPLVRDVFRATAVGGVVWGGDESGLRAWLGEAAPWKTRLAVAGAEQFGATNMTLGKSDSVAAHAPTAAEEEGLAVGSVYNGTTARQRFDAAEARRDVSANVVQYQQARKEIQEVARLRNASDVAASHNASVNSLPSVAVASPPSTAASSMTKASMAMADEAIGTGGPAASQDFEREPLAPAEVGDFDALAAATLPQETNHFPLIKNEVADANAEARVNQFIDTLSTSSGWMPWRDTQGDLHLFAWRELPDRTVIGCELAMDAVTSRVRELFPKVSGRGPWEIYSLFDEGPRFRRMILDDSRVISIGTTSRFSVEVPLSSVLLPSWWVRGNIYGVGPEPTTTGVFGPGAVIVALLLVGILAAGVLLVRRVRLSEAEAALKTSFVANVSHELKTPLTTIRLYAELLAQGRVREPAKQADYLATIGQETQRLARLVGNVLDFSRLEQGRKKYERAGFDLAADLRRLAEIHGPRLAGAGLELHLEAPENLDVTTDHDAVEQIVLNLLDNACKYAAEGGEVTVILAAREAARGIELRVADRGPGVPAEQRERIFEKFHRVDDRLTAEKGGAGLGLSIARQLARGLGGELRCAARAGGGAEFILTLP